MEPSEEIRRVIDRWMTANSEGDADAVLGKVWRSAPSSTNEHARRRWHGDDRLHGHRRFTVLTARLGDHAWLDLLRLHNAVIEDPTAAHGGTVVETQGEGSMLAFSSARRAVACAQAIQREIDSAFADDSPPIRVRDRRPFIHATLNAPVNAPQGYSQ